MPKVVYSGPLDAVEVPLDGDRVIVAVRGEPVDVPDEVAGRAPKGEPGTDGYDAGAGLLAQADWSAPTAPKKDAAVVTPAAPTKDGE